MEFLFTQLKRLEVISVSDGKNLGKIVDCKLTLPEGKVLGFFVTGCKGLKLTKSDEFISINEIVKIGEDAILVKAGDKDKPSPPPKERKKNFCPPCPPPCPPCPPDNCGNRRNFDDCE